MTDTEEEMVDAAPSDDHRPESAASARRRHDGDPDVLLDVPQLRVDEISLEVQDLKARVSLQASVLELLNLHVGVDAELGRVQLTIKGVEAQVLLKVHLDNVARILDRVLTTIDNNPQIVEQIGGAVEEVGTGAGEAIGDLGASAGSAVEELGEGAGTAVDNVGRGAGRAVEDVGEGVEATVEDLEGEAPAPQDADEDMEAEARPRRRAQRDAEDRPRRRRRAESTEDRSRKTSRSSRDRGPEKS